MSSSNGVSRWTDLIFLLLSVLLLAGMKLSKCRNAIDFDFERPDCNDCFGMAIQKVSGEKVPYLALTASTKISLHPKGDYDLIIPSNAYLSVN